jgi:flagellar protein FliO/FliZ
MTPAVLISASMEGAAQFLTVLIIFFIVLGLTYFTTRFVGNYQKMQGFNRNFEPVETLRIGNNKFLQIVRVGKRYYLIAIGKDEINMLSELSEEDLDLNADAPAMNDRFRQMLETAREKMTKRGDRQ